MAENDGALRPGDPVEFWSGEGRWKPGIVAPQNPALLLEDEPLYDRRNQRTGVRIETGPGVWVNRDRKRVRPRVAAEELCDEAQA